MLFFLIDMIDDLINTGSYESSSSSYGPSREEAERRRLKEAERVREEGRKERKRSELEDFCDTYNIPLQPEEPDTAFGLVESFIQEKIDGNIATFSYAYDTSNQAKKKLKKACSIDELCVSCDGVSIQIDQLAAPFIKSGEKGKPIVAVMGQMNGGKSALLNGIVGKDVFSVADRRETAKIKKYEEENFIFMDTKNI